MARDIIDGWASADASTYEKQSEGYHEYYSPWLEEDEIQNILEKNARLRPIYIKPKMPWQQPTLSPAILPRKLNLDIGGPNA